MKKILPYLPFVGAVIFHCFVAGDTNPHAGKAILALYALSIILGVILYNFIGNNHYPPSE